MAKTETPQVDKLSRVQMLGGFSIRYGSRYLSEHCGRTKKVWAQRVTGLFYHEFGASILPETVKL